MQPRILLLQTGGTLDSKPYPDPYNPPQYVETLKGDASLLAPALITLRGHETVDLFHWNGDQEKRLNKDSQKFTPDDIRELAEIIRHDERKYFVLTHGTDAAVENATLLEKQLEGSGKTVVFAGAMVPLSMHALHPSDFIPTLQFTLDTIRDLSPGVYIAGRDSKTRRLGFFTPAMVEKDREASKADLQFTLKARG